MSAPPDRQFGLYPMTRVCVRTKLGSWLLLNQPHNKQVACKWVAQQVFKMSGHIGEQKQMQTKGACGCARGRRPLHLSLANRTVPERTTRNHHNNTIISLTPGVMVCLLSTRSPDLCLMSSHVDVYRGSLQTKNIIIWKITMSILHAIGARWWTTNRGDALQCPTSKLRHGEPHPCSMFFHLAHPKDSSEEIGACHVNTVGT